MEGIEIKIDKLARLVIPAKMRKKLGIVSGDKLLIRADDTSLIITPLAKRCSLCKVSQQQPKLNPF